MTFTVGGTDVNAVYLGATPVDAVYLGDEKVWPVGPVQSTWSVVPLAGFADGDHIADGHTGTPDSGLSRGFWYIAYSDQQGASQRDRIASLVGVPVVLTMDGSPFWSGTFTTAPQAQGHRLTLSPHMTQLPPMGAIATLEPQ